MPSRYNPVYSFFKTLQYLFSGRLRLHPEENGAVFTRSNGQRFTVFRCLEITPDQTQPAQPGAIFIPQFHVAGMSARLNRWFSWLPIPFYIGMPGFRSKRWMVDETNGDFAGYYEWDSVEAAENYSRSFAARFMTGRSVPGSVSFHAYPRETAPAMPQKEKPG
ncbi:MAG TPA: hypothetical protein PKW33_13745 [Anaerolineaceae bacterium]|nr:hypothetical protein [Anaerolineaceae bacterium]HPN52650.1 hypothetical protein [Anaerolineaceae bacterium]